MEYTDCALLTEEKAAWERTGNPPSYGEVKKMKTLVFHTHLLPLARPKELFLLSLFIFFLLLLLLFFLFFLFLFLFFFFFFAFFFFAFFIFLLFFFVFFFLFFNTISNCSSSDNTAKTR